MNPSEKSLAQILQIEGTRENYFVPKYQRSYAWKRENWDEFLNDLTAEPEHFMGSIICVPRISSDISPGDPISYELIDGQQRLTTISLLLCATYKKLIDLRPGNANNGEVFDKWKQLQSSIYRKLVVERTGSLRSSEIPIARDRNKAFFARMLPSGQSNNRDDYITVLGECGAILKSERPANWGNRKIALCFKHFLDKLPSKLDELSQIVERLNNLKFIHISVPSQADAYRLFEALNNRGTPLTALDIIKNGLLARMEITEPGSIENAFDSWKAMLDELSDDDAVHERYLRHFYHAFRHDPKIGIAKFPRATKSNLIRIYHALIENDPKHLLKQLHEKSRLYQNLINPDVSKAKVSRRDVLSDLNRISAAPSYQLLLFLLDCEVQGFIDDKNFDEVAKFLCRYFVRRNITDKPGTNRLDPIFSSLIGDANLEIKKRKFISSDWIIKRLRDSKSDPPANDKEFEAELKDNLWEYEATMVRYLLCKLNELQATREYKPNLWRRGEKGRLVWTVEHILPQGERMKPEWVQMIAGGDKAKARKLQEEWVHCLGNLTLSAYNSKLSDKPFNDKQKKQEITADREKISIGYKNRLPINELQFKCGGKMTSLAQVKQWTVAEIQARNDAIVKKCMQLFKL